MWLIALKDRDYPENVEDHIDSMSDSEIDYCALEPVTKDELAAAAKDLLAEVGSSSGPAYDKVLSMLRLLEIDVSDLDQAAAPRV